MAAEIGGQVLYVATALPGEDEDLGRRVRLHRERRPPAWGTVEVGDLGGLVDDADGWDAVLVDSLTLWVSARLFSAGEDATLKTFDDFLRDVSTSGIPFLIVSDEVGLGVVPESAAGRVFRDVLGTVNQRAAEASEEVHLCVAGVGVRIR